MSPISAIGNIFSQNIKELKSYYQVIDTQQYAITPGISLTQDDMIWADDILLAKKAPFLLSY